MTPKSLSLIGAAASLILAMALSPVVAVVADDRDVVLAEALASESTRESAVASIMASRQDKIPLLLSWSKKSPLEYECRLFDGLAYAFGRLKATEAIPFLVENISQYGQCGNSFNPWSKAPSVIESSFPAIGALVKIGPDASRAVMAAFPRMTKQEDRMAAMFTVSRVPSVPEARAFLTSALARPDWEHHWAARCLRILEAGSNR
jgi:hypothetical protein